MAAGSNVRRACSTVATSVDCSRTGPAFRSVQDGRRRDLGAAATIVLEHFAGLGIVPRSVLKEYLRLPGPRAAERAEQILADLRTRARERKLVKEQARQSAGLTQGARISRTNPR